MSTKCSITLQNADSGHVHVYEDANDDLPSPVYVELECSKATMCLRMPAAAFRKMAGEIRLWLQAREEWEAAKEQK